MDKMKVTPFEKVLDDFYGKVGTPRRDEHERQVAEAVYAAKIGEAIKEARLRQEMTQDELGEKVGVKKSQISRLERGYSITIPTMSKVFRALGINSGVLDLGSAGKVALW